MGHSLGQFDKTSEIFQEPTLLHLLQSPELGGNNTLLPPSLSPAIEEIM